jgi:N-acetylmuramoyl-L-alanine amidase
MEAYMIILSKKRITLVLTCVLVGIFTFMLQATKTEVVETVPTVTLPVSGKTIVVDAGHGVPDEG